MYTIHPDCEVIFSEKPFYLFKHDNLFCAVYRMAFSGNLNGYVAVPKGHTLYGKDYRDEIEVPNLSEIKFNGNYLGLLCVDAEKAQENIITLDMAINVHYGLTYSDNQLSAIEDDLLGNQWWFGFDTAHSGDLKPYQSEIDRKYKHHSDTYKNFEFVMAETKSLAEQLSKF